MTLEATGVSIAVVMPAHRCGDDLARSVASIDALDPPPDEFVIVVDGAQPDVIEQVDATHSVIAIPASGPAAARNAGARHTRSDILLFVDSDIVVPSDLVDRIRAAFGPTDTRAGGERRDAVFGAYDDAPDSPETVSQFRNLLHHWTHHQSAGPAHTFWAGCGAVRRSAFEAVSGFDERFRDATIEDIELGERLSAAGFRIDVIPTIEVKHLKRWTLVGMAVTDVTKRGVPWSRLMFRLGALSNDLNTTRAARVNVALVGLLAATILGSVVPSPLRRSSVVVASLIAPLLVWRDRAFLGYLAQVRSIGFAARSVPLLWVHHCCAGIAFAWAAVTWPWFDRQVS